MVFNLVDSYHIKCKETYDENNVTIQWDGIILVNDNGHFIGTTINNDDVRELIIGNFKHDKEFELYRFFDGVGSVYLYQFPSEYSTTDDSFGTFKAITSGGLGGLGDCSFEVTTYKGDSQEIVSFYQDTFSRICEANDALKISIISQIFMSKDSHQEVGKEPYMKKPNES